MASKFSVDPNSTFVTANVPKTITVKPLAANTGEAITKKLRIKAQGYDDKIITLTQRAAPTET